MIDFFKRIFHLGDYQVFGGIARSPLWPAARKAHLKRFPTCAVTGATNDLEVHHIKPYHLHRELELDPQNLITLTTKFGSLNAHLWFGHLGVFTSYNETVREDAEYFGKKIKERP